MPPPRTPAAPVRAQIAAALKSSPIWSGAISRSSWRAIVSARSGRARCQRRGARLDPEPAQELALGQQGGARAGRARRGQNGREVGVHGQVRLAGRSQRASTFWCPLERLQRVAAARRVAAVVDRAAPRRPGATRRSASSAANASCAGERSITVPTGASSGASGSVAGRRPKASSPCSSRPTTRSAQPRCGALELAGRQAVEQLVGDQQQRRVGRQLGERGRPARRRVRQPLGLQRLQRRATVSISQSSAAATNAGASARGPQQVAHQRPVARPGLGQHERAAARPARARSPPAQARSARRTSARPAAR